MTDFSNRAIISIFTRLKENPVKNQLYAMKRIILLFGLIFFYSLTFSQSCWKTISAGNSHTIAVKTDGTLWGWGYNYYGQLGDGTTINKAVPTQIGTENNWQSASAAYGHTAAIKTDGTLWTWGNNEVGELGDGTYTNKTTPVKIGIASDWQLISAGSAYTIAIKTNGTIWAWGSNYQSQLGDGTRIDKNYPIQIGTDANWKSVSANGHYGPLAIKNNGTLWAWGRGGYGQFGDGTFEDKFIPTQIGNSVDWLSVSAGSSHTIAIKTNGTLWVTGNDRYGQLGIGPNPLGLENVFVQVGTNNTWQSVSGGGNHTVAIKKDGTLWAWGWNSYGQLGDKTNIDKNTPVQIGITNDWEAVSAGDAYTIAFKKDGTLWAWGANNNNQLGNNTTLNQNTPIQISQNITPSVNIGASPAGAICDGTNVVFTAVPLNGGASPSYQWKVNGLNTGTNINSFSTSLLKNGDVVSVVMTSNKSCLTTASVNSNAVVMSILSALQPPVISINNYILSVQSPVNGPNYQWFYSPSSTGPFTLLPDITGVNCRAIKTGYYKATISRAGCNTMESNTIYCNLNTPETCWKSIAAGDNHTTAVKADGTLFTWGRNQYGQLGDASYTFRYSPVQIGAANNWQTISANLAYTAAIKIDGTLWAWGTGTFGQYGDNTTIILNSPTQIGTATNWHFVSAGTNHSVAIKTNGTLWAWGRNAFGQIGDGTVVNKNFPVQVGGDIDWQTVSGGGSHSVGVKTNGTLWAWGYNNFGQLGDGTVASKNTPIQIGTNNNWKDVSAGNSHTIAVKTDGTLWAWGDNAYGQLGDGTSAVKNSPVQIGTAADWRSVSAGYNYSFAIKEDGTIWSWGANNFSQLGDGTITNKNSPAQIGADKNWQKISANYDHSMAVKTDGTIWVWGANNYGQLGDGTTTSRKIPSQISSFASSVTPAVSIVSSATGEVCPGTNIVFSALPTNGGNLPSYQWKLNGINAGSNSNTFSTPTLTNGDVVNVIMTSSATCASASVVTSNSINISMTSVQTPVISTANNIISVQSPITGAQYQWYFSTAPTGTFSLINAAVSTTYTITQTGYYKVTITQNSCSPVESNVITGIVTAVNDPNNIAARIVIYPSPITDGNMVITGIPQTANNLIISVYELNGSIVLKKEAKQIQGKLNISLASLSSGMFIVNIQYRLAGKMNQARYKIIKQ
jgi:alpha-tubulin suppressor-like RCC1 family protein